LGEERSTSAQTRWGRSASTWPPTPGRSSPVVPFACHIQGSIPGSQRTTTVTSTPPTSWSSSPEQQERIPRICLIRMRSRWSALGPHGIGNRWSSLVTSGQRRPISIAGQRPFTVTTLDGAAARRWVRIPPVDCPAVAPCDPGNWSPARLMDGPVQRHGGEHVDRCRKLEERRTNWKPGSNTERPGRSRDGLQQAASRVTQRSAGRDCWARRDPTIGEQAPVGSCAGPRRVAR
jgi:hypothetical protein